MRFFKVLQPVLSRTLDEICRTYGLNRSDAFSRVEAFVKANSENWRLDEPNIKYEEPLCRMAYLYMNVAVHAHLVETALTQFDQLGQTIREKISKGEELRVCALGGGPGSELLGLVRYVESLNAVDKPAYIDFVLVDRIKEWDESWHALKTGIDSYFRENCGSDRSQWPVAISRSFLPLDASDPTEFENFATRFAGIDVFLVCYLASELKAKMSQFRQVLEVLLQRANSGAWLLFVDRDERVVREAVVDLIQNMRALSLNGIVEHRGQLQESLEELGEWFINIEPLPRQRWLAFFALARKD